MQCLWDPKTTKLGENLWKTHKRLTNSCVKVQKDQMVKIFERQTMNEGVALPLIYPLKKKVTTLPLLDPSGHAVDANLSISGYLRILMHPDAQGMSPSEGTTAPLLGSAGASTV